MSITREEQRHLEKRRRKISRGVGYGVSFGALVMSVIFGIRTLPRTSSADLAPALVLLGISVAISVFVSTGIFLYEFSLQLDTFGDKLDVVQTDIDNVVVCRYLGSGTSVLSTVLERANKARQVRNTLDIFNISESETASTTYTRADVKDIQHHIISVLKKKDGAWTDVVSHDLFNSEVFRDLYSDIRSLPPSVAARGYIAKHLI